MSADVRAHGASPRTVQDLYAQRGIGGCFQLGVRPAVLVVDLQQGFTDTACAAGLDLDDAVAATHRLLSVARRLRRPVIFTVIAYEPHLDDLGVWGRKMPGLGELQLGTRWAELDARLERDPGEPVVVKKGASALFGTNVASMLVGAGADTVVLCGATTSGCVRATAVDLVQHGWPTLVPRESVGDRAREPHEANLFDMQSKYADVVSTDQAIEFLERCGGNGREP